MSFATGLKRTFINADQATIEDLTVTDLTVTNDVQVNHNLTVDNDTTIGNDLLVGNDAQVGNDLTVVGDELVQGNTVVTGTVTSSGFLQRAQPAPLIAYLLVPAGTIVLYAASSAPGGWLLCDGSAVSRTAYNALYAAIGTNFGIGDNLTTFNVPDLRGRVALGTGAGAGLTSRALAASGGSESITEVPPHTHNISDPGHYHTYYGVSGQDVLAGETDTAADENNRPVENTSAVTTGITVQNTGTNVSATAVQIMNPYLVVTYIIKV